MPRKTMEQQARREFVVNAARRLFTEKDIEEVSMEEIAEAVDYTRRTLYSYFTSRDEICLMVFIGDMKARWALQKEAMPQAGNGLQKIIAWAESLFAYVRENPLSMRLNAWWDYRGIDESKINAEVFSDFEKINEELAEGLREIFELGISDGSLRPGLNVDMCISHFLYSLRAVLNRALSTGYSFTSFDASEYVDSFIALFTRGICNTKGDRR
jgi:TetR/AcrR family transcriptional regulator